MLLDRRKVRFWQKIIFGFMAFLMAAFLVVGYSGVLNSCRLGSSIVGNTADEEVRKAIDAAKAAPKDPVALLAAAQAYQARALSASEGSAEQAGDFAQALAYYKRYLALSDKVLGARARQDRIDALTNEVLIYTKQSDAKGLVSVYNQLIGVDPRNPLNFLQLGTAATSAGDAGAALLAFSRFLEISPHSQYAKEVKQRIRELKSQLKKGPAPSPSPTK